MFSLIRAQVKSGGLPDLYTGGNPDHFNTHSHSQNSEFRKPLFRISNWDLGKSKFIVQRKSTNIARYRGGEEVSCFAYKAKLYYLLTNRYTA